MSTFRLPIIIYLLLILQGCRQNPAADGGTWPHVNDTVDACIARLDSISFTRADIPADELAALDSMSDILPPGVLDFWHARAMRGSLSRDSATAILNRALKSADSASQPYIYHRLWSESMHLDDNPGIREVNGIHRCYEYFTTAGDKKMSLATCISLGNIYLRMRLYSRSRTWMDRADSIADIVGLPLIKKKMRINRASLYMREEHLDSAEMILRPLVGDPEMTVDPPTYNTILRNLYICTNDYHILETARAALDTINGGENMKVAFEILTSTHFSNLNMPDSAAIYASRAFSHINDADNIELKEYIVLNKADACLYLGKTDSAAMLYSQYIALNDSADLVSKHETLTRMKEIADLAESEKAAVITRYRRIVGTIIAIAIILSVGLYIRNYRRRQMLFIEQARARELQSQLELEKSRKHLDSLTLVMEERENTLASIESEIRTLRDSGKLSPADVAAVNSIIRSHDHDRIDWDLFMSRYEANNSHFITRLREQYPRLSDSQVKLAMLIRMGLSSKQISRLLQVRPMTVNQNRWHLRSAMGLGKDESIEQTLADLT